MALGLVALALIVAAAPLSVAAHRRWTSGLNGMPLVLGWAVMGFVLARRQPRHPMGWLLLGVAIFFLLNGAASNYSVIDYRVHHGSLPLGPVAVLLQPAWAPAILLSGLALLLFPDGRLPTSRLRWVVWAYLAIAALWMVGAYVIAAAAIIGHNIHIESSGDLVAIDHPTGTAAWWGRVQNLFFPVLGATWLIWLVAQIPGYRRSTGESRQQLKWLLSGASIFALSGVATVAFSGSGNGFLSSFGNAALAGTVALPLSIGVGILKYRLYEIDRLVSRTLSYAILTGLLVGVFLGIVVLANARAAVLVAGRRRGLDAGRRGAVQPAAPAGAAPRRPSLQPRPLRRGGDCPGVHDAVARRGRPRHGSRRAAARGRPRGRARSRLGVAQAAEHRPVTFPERSAPRLARMTNSLRAIYRFWAMLLFPAVIVQIGAAGYGAFNAANKLSDTTPVTQKQFDHGFSFHTGFGYILFLAALLLFVFALAARLGRKRVLLALAAPLLFFLQIVLAIIGGGTPAIGVLHPVNALVIAGFTGYLAREAHRRTWTIAAR